MSDILTPAERESATATVREATDYGHREHNALALIADALQRIAAEMERPRLARAELAARLPEYQAARAALADAATRRPRA